MQVRKLLIGVVATVTAVALAVVGADFGAAIYAEYRLARSVRTAANLSFDPWVSILGFPFITQATRRHYNEIEIKASGVDHAVLGEVGLEATMHSVDLADVSWLIGPDAKLPVGEPEPHHHRLHPCRAVHGHPDLLVEAPSRETNDATGGTTESGISSNRGLVFTGTPNKAAYNKKVSIAVDLSIAGPDQPR